MQLIDKRLFMKNFIFVLILIVFAGCSAKNDVLVTKNTYPDISKNAIFNAAKTLFNLSNKENGNKDFIIDSYRDKLEVDKIIFKNNIVHVDVLLDKWILELHQTENETRAILTVTRKNTQSDDNIGNIDQKLHNLFWDRLDYLLGLKKDWKLCNQYFSYNILNDYCNNYFITFRPEDSYIQKNILISKTNIDKKARDNEKVDIYNVTDLSLIKSNSDIFDQSENIEDANILSPIISEDLFETAQHENNLESYENEGIDENGENKTIYQDVQIDKFKETLENIINKRPQNQNTDSNDTTFDSNNIN